MKVLCVVPSYMPAIKFGGPIFSVHDMNNALVKKGIDVTVYTTNAGLSPSPLLSPALSLAEGSGIPVNREIILDGVKVTYFGFVSALDFLNPSGWKYSPLMAGALKRNLSTFDIVYIVAVWNYPVAAAAHYCRKFGKPYIISPRGLIYPYTMGKKSWKKLPYFHLVAKRDLRGARAVHYTSTDEAESCHDFLGLKNDALVIPNGIDTGKFANLPSGEGFRRRYGIGKDDKVILFLGRINWKKGLDVLIKSFAMLLKERGSVRLLIAGGDDEGYGGKVRGWIKDAGLTTGDGGDVIFTGMLDGEEKLEALSASDIFVLPSYSENFGMAAVEAMASGLPVVVSRNVGISKDIERSSAGVVVEATAEGVYAGMKQLFDDDTLSKEMSENGKKMALEYYDIDKVADRMIEAYSGVIGWR